jgi:hypothetical protein
MSARYCPGCFAHTGLRTIGYGLPAGELEPEIYVLGGCIAEDRSPQLQCLECDWQGTVAEVGKATRARRFFYTDEDARGLILFKKLRLSHEALALLQESKMWQNARSLSTEFTTNSVYGPEGKLNQFWPTTWESPEQMRLDLMQNMGGGVPIEVIDELVKIVHDLNGPIHRGFDGTIPAVAPIE